MAEAQASPTVAAAGAAASLPSRRRRWWAPEVVQTSTMDCGPAALKCLLEGFHVPVSYGRLREACQTDVDGTSIDTVEVVAQQLGLDATQVMLPADHLLAPHRATLPALVVVRQTESATHFVVVWRRLGPWLQVMDPAQGRRWVHAERFGDQLYRHALAVDAADWRDWAGSPEFTQVLQQRLQALGLDPAAAQSRIAAALADVGWRAIAALDAAVRLVQALASAQAVARGADAARLLDVLGQRLASAEAADPLAGVPAAYWSVTQDAADPGRLMLHGAVALQVAGRRPRVPDGAQDPRPCADGAAGTGVVAGTGLAAVPDAAPPPLSPELAAALGERPHQVLASVWQLLRDEGLLAPLALAAAIGVATGGVLLETGLLRGLFDLSASLNLSGQRLAAMAGLLAFLALLLAVELPIAREVLRQGRHLETRLRMALLRKLPRLNDRYFQSRPISDMADRSHSLQLTRGLPPLAFQLLRSAFDLLFTVAGLLFIAPASAGWALALLAVALAGPTLAQPLLGERDLRARIHAGALNSFYLDALLGSAPVRAHRAQRSVSQQHESLLVDWAAAMRGWIRVALLAEGTQALLCTTLAGGLLVSHFLQAGSMGGADLLLVYWTLKLPVLGGRIAALAQQVPAQRNVLQRLLEPLAAPDDAADAPSAAAAPARGAAGLQIDGGSVLAGGHTLLQGVDLRIGPGEHVAIVGVSGAGKSTLLGLWLGWHRLSGGRLLLDGQVAGAAELEALRRTTAWVDPAIQLWNRPLLDNLAYAMDDDGLPRLGAAMETAQLRGLLRRLPQGLQTLLGEGGSLLSGGEGQRVRLGRALLAADTRLALLDEPFRGLDRRQRQALLAEARAWWRDVTLLCVTHDVGETLGFDRVLVVEDGRLVEDGAPQQLRTQASRYRDLLDAEQRVQQSLWQGAAWHRLSVRDGGVHDTGIVAAGAPPAARPAPGAAP